MNTAQAKRWREQRQERWDAGGEGSRGGKVIGRTKGGKPIYMNHGHSGHKDFTSREHDEAEALHFKLSMSLREKQKKVSTSEGTKFSGQIAHHGKQAQLHARSKRA